MRRRWMLSLVLSLVWAWCAAGLAREGEGLLRLVGEAGSPVYVDGVFAGLLGDGEPGELIVIVPYGERVVWVVEDGELVREAVVFVGPATYTVDLGVARGFEERRAFAPNVLWQEQFGTGATGAWAAAVAGAGSVVVGGLTAADFSDDPLGRCCAFVRVYEADGVVAWQDEFGPGGMDAVMGVAANAGGWIAVAGLTNGYPVTLEWEGSNAFLRVYDETGGVVWEDRFAIDRITWGLATAIGQSGGVAVVGSTAGDPGFRVLDLFAADEEVALERAAAFARTIDAFVRAYDPEGGLLWEDRFGAPEGAGAVAVAASGSDLVVITGNTPKQWRRGRVDDEGVEAFVRVYGGGGSVVWEDWFGSEAGTSASGVAVDGSGHIAVVGTTRGGLVGTNAGGTDAFVRVYDGSGRVLWEDQFGGNRDDGATGVAVDPAGSVVVVGVTRGASTVGSDAFVRVYDVSGRVWWEDQFGGSRTHTSVMGVAVDQAGRVAVVGHMLGDLTGVESSRSDSFVRVYDGSAASPSDGPPAIGHGVGSFRISVGAFGDPDNAARQARLFRDAGFPVFTGTVGDLTVVLVGPYDGVGEALAVAERIADGDLGIEPAVYRFRPDALTPGAFVPPPGTAAGRYLQVGAFSESSASGPLRERLAALGLLVHDMREDGLIKLLVGPFDDALLAEVRRVLSDHGIEGFAR